jgi:hypothetical protein
MEDKKKEHYAWIALCLSWKKKESLQLWENQEMIKKIKP